MTTTRERLERRWTPARVVLLIVGVVVTLAVLAAGLALWWLPPVLAETPRERYEAPTRVTVQDATGSVGVEVAAGWVPLGVGPFLSADEATLVSPDGAYRAELGLATLPDTSPTSLAAAAASLLAAHDLGTAATSTPSADAPAAPTPSAVAPAPPTPAADARASGARWSEETLATGATVRYTDVVRGDTTYTVALLLPPAVATAADANQTAAPAPDEGQAATGQPDRGAPIAGSALALTLVAAVRSDDAAAYRTVTADLLTSATVSPTPTSTSTSSLPPPPAPSPSPAAARPAPARAGIEGSR